MPKWVVIPSMRFLPLPANFIPEPLIVYSATSRSPQPIGVLEALVSLSLKLQ